MAITDKLYQLFFKRSTVYIPFVLVGAYFANEAVDLGINTVWETRNQGKLFKHMTFPEAE